VTHQLRLAVIPLYLLLCLLLGGASAAGFWANMVLQLLAVVLLFWAAISQRSAAMPTPGRHLTVLVGLLAALILAQLIPLPPSVWTTLPGRGPVAEGFRLVGEALPWLPLSLSAARTIGSALWLLPAAAMLFGIIRLGAFRNPWFAWVLAIVAVASVGIGALQMVGGEQSPWYIYEITNFGVTVGFFSNANHMGTMLVATIPFLAALYVSARARGHSVQRNSGMVVVLAGTLVIVFVGLAASGSLAALGLSVPVLAGSMLMILSRKRKAPRWAAALIALLLVASVAGVFSAPLGNNLTSETAKTSQESRYTSFTRTIDAAKDFMPFGSGIGSFNEVYRSREDPAGITSRFYMNHVHGDYIEMALETGLPGLLLLALFLLWWGRRVIAIWGAEEADYYARAATIASAAILAHSLVDYPLRTAAISAILAMCCALMAEPRAKTRRSRRGEDEAKPEARHLSAD